MLGWAGPAGGLFRCLAQDTPAFRGMSPHKHTAPRSLQPSPQGWICPGQGGDPNAAGVWLRGREQRGVKRKKAGVKLFWLGSCRQKVHL